MTKQELASLADAWIGYFLAAKGSVVREKTAWATDLYELEYDDPETLWLLILEIHAKDQSAQIQQVLAAGPVEGLLARDGERFIERIEIQARQDSKFAKLLGGVWKSGMSNEVWSRVQSVWDRRGWDGIPE
jgi:hypothetical protein